MVCLYKCHALVNWTSFRQLRVVLDDETARFFRSRHSWSGAQAAEVRDGARERAEPDGARPRAAPVPAHVPHDGAHNAAEGPAGGRGLRADSVKNRRRRSFILRRIKRQSPTSLSTESGGGRREGLRSESVPAWYMRAGDPRILSSMQHADSGRPARLHAPGARRAGTPTSPGSTSRATTPGICSPSTCTLDSHRQPAGDLQSGEPKDTLRSVPAYDMPLDVDFYSVSEQTNILGGREQSPSCIDCSPTILDGTSASAGKMPVALDHGRPSVSKSRVNARDFSPVE